MIKRFKIVSGWISGRMHVFGDNILTGAVDLEAGSIRNRHQLRRVNPLKLLRYLKQMKSSMHFHAPLYCGQLIADQVFEHIARLNHGFVIGSDENLGIGDHIGPQ